MMKVILIIGGVVVGSVVGLFMLGVYATYSAAKYMNDSGMY